MSILVIAAHPDDEVLGCGASIAKWSNESEDVHILIMAEGITSREKERDRISNFKQLSLLEESVQQSRQILGAKSATLLNFPDNRMDSLNRLDVIKAIEKEVERVRPHTVVTHHSGDLNIDHRITHEAVVTACRPQPGHPVRRLLAFEIPSSTEWQLAGSNMQFFPNWFEDVGNVIDRKIEALMVYESEMREWPHARSLRNVENLAQWRGSSIGYKAAEAFMLIREVRWNH